jgi:hypothetical protein
MRNPKLVLQNVGGDRGPAAAPNDRAVRAPQASRVLTPQETDQLLSESLWSRRVRRVLTDFQDNYSGDFHLFRIY